MAQRVLVVHNGLTVDTCREIETLLRHQGLDTDLRYCSLESAEVEEKAQGCQWILALGNEALKAATGHSGVMSYRGKVMELAGRRVMATISPSMVRRQPGRRQGWEADLRFFVNQVNGRGPSCPRPKLKLVMTGEGVEKMGWALSQAKVMAYDVETVGLDEFRPNVGIVSISCRLDSGFTWCLPLYHPEAPWEKDWVQVFQLVGQYFPQVKEHRAHNGKFDARWCRRFGVKARVDHDSMLMVHVLDENESKELKAQARTRMGVKNWDLNVKDYRAEPIRRVLRYNGFDAHYTYELVDHAIVDLERNRRSSTIYHSMYVPATEELIRTERRGVWTDRRRLRRRTRECQRTLDDIESELMEWVPHPREWPDNIEEVNFNASNFARWWLFTHLGLPVVGETKTGMPQMSEDVLMELRGQHPAVDVMLRRVKWQKYRSSFFAPYLELIDDDDRIHTSFKLHGTVTGRLSSGKIEQEKVAAKSQRRGVNMQQVPRDPFVRGLFGAPPGYVFFEADFSQIELRVAAILSGDRTMIQLYQAGEDIHVRTASYVLGKPASRVTKDDRKKAKAVNFGFLYGMGPEKFIYTAFTKYDVVFSMKEAKAVRRAFFEQFSGLPAWHDKQRRLAHKYKQVVSPIGRVRRLPDVDSGDHAVRAEAERQAINAPVQGFASDMTLLAMVLLAQEFRRRRLRAWVVGLVHDALNFEAHADDAVEAMRLAKHVMENLPLESMFDLTLSVPIRADLKLGSHWGDAEELDDEALQDDERMAGLVYLASRRPRGREAA